MIAGIDDKSDRHWQGLHAKIESAGVKVEKVRQEFETKIEGIWKELVR